MVKHHYYGSRKGNKDFVECLVEHGTDINIKNKNGITSLFYAYESGNNDLIEYLIEHGAGY
ncbi:ankyrin repeat-containing domain protein, partial [Neocallimastix lanati (nom. inval.)]